MKNIVCVDFDGTVVDHRFPEVGQDAPEAEKWLNLWAESGIYIILHTMRSDGQESGDVLTDAIMWFARRNISLWMANSNPEQHTWTTSPKPYAQIYVDDAAYGCPLIHPKGFARPCVDWSIVGPGVLDQFGIEDTDGVQEVDGEE